MTCSARRFISANCKDSCLLLPYIWSAIVSRAGTRRILLWRELACVRHRQIASTLLLIFAVIFGAVLALMYYTYTYQVCGFFRFILPRAHRFETVYICYFIRDMWHTVCGAYNLIYLHDEFTFCILIVDVAIFPDLTRALVASSFWVRGPVLSVSVFHA